MMDAPRACLVALVLAACGGDDKPAADATDDTGLPCLRDDVEEPAQATALGEGGATGYLCPVGDVDWYRFSTGPNDHLLRVTLAMDGDISPVEPAYVVWTVGPDGAPAVVAAAAPPQRLGFPLDEIHCVAPGDYVISVRDDGEDAQDFRRPYTFSMTSSADPDPAEPNDDEAGAAALAPGSPAAGAIACVGDSDWYTFDVPDGAVVGLRLTMPVGGIAPSLRLRDAEGNVIAARENASGTVRPTDLVLESVLPRGGRYFAVVTDDDGKNADAETTYSLALTLADDTDPNEPNGHPEVATPLSESAVPCGAAWSGWLTATGNIGAPGDNDWFRLPLSACGPQGVLEAEVELLDTGLGNAARWALAQKIQLALTAVRAHPASPCDDDQACQELTRSCDNDFDCSGLFNTCLPDGFCAGAGVCLPTGNCGANIVQRRYEPPPTPVDPSATAPPPHRAVVTTPLFADEVVFLRIADFQSDAGDRTVSYRLRARVISEPDHNEPSNVYDIGLLEDFPVAIQAGAAKPITVHDCTTPLGGGTPDCCGADDWIEGVLSYENDLDFYAYTHPCPGEDCNLRIVYEFEGGPVDFVLSVYEGESLWFGGVAGATSEQSAQPSMSGAYGGSGACFYAYQGHEGEDFLYHVAIRDLATVRDASADQAYRFCVERTSRACDAPCKLYPNGCGQP